MFTQLTQRVIDESPMKKSFYFKCYRNKKELIVVDDQDEINELMRIAHEYDFTGPIEIDGKVMHVFIRAEDWQDHSQDMQWRTQFISDMLDDDWANEFFYKFRVPEGGMLGQIRTAVMELGLPKYDAISHAYNTAIAGADKPLPPGYSVIEQTPSDEELEQAVTDNAVLQHQAEERLPEIDTPPDEGDDNFGNYAEDNDKD